MTALIRKVRDFSELVAFEHTIFSSSFILMAMVVASLQKNHSIWFGFEILLLCALALCSARNFAMGFNRLVDSDIDVKNSRTSSRPSVDGRISRFSLIAFNAFNALIFIATSYFINDLALNLSIPFLAILAAYSFFKRFSALAHWILGICLALAPIAGVIAILGEIPLWCIFLSIGVAFWVAGFDLLYSLQDMEFDKSNHLHSIPSKFGMRFTLIISRICHIIAVCNWSVFVYIAGLNALAISGVVASALMLVYEQYLVAKHLDNIPKAFFATNGYLGIIFLAFIIADGVFYGF